MAVLVFTAGLQGTRIMLPVSLFLWAFVMAYCIHILEEALLGECFVDKVKRLYWKNYSWKKFFGFNTIMMGLEIISVLLYDSFGGAVLILPLSLFFERVLNGFYHLGETIITKRFSSGLVTSVMFWILWYLICKYGFAAGQIPPVWFYTSMLIGVLVEILMFCSMWIKVKMESKNGR